MKIDKTKRSLNTTDVLKLCSLMFPEKTKPILDRIIRCDERILVLTKELSMKTSLEIIKEIEDVRAENNTNWMDLIRLAFEHAPEEAEIIMGRIHENDETITNLFKTLSETFNK